MFIHQRNKNVLMFFSFDNNSKEQDLELQEPQLRRESCKSITKRTVLEESNQVTDEKIPIHSSLNTHNSALDQMPVEEDIFEEDIKKEKEEEGEYIYEDQ